MGVNAAEGGVKPAECCGWVSEPQRRGGSNPETHRKGSSGPEPRLRGRQRTWG